MTVPIGRAKFKLLELGWITVALACALAFVTFVSVRRTHRVLQVASTPQWSVDGPTIDATSPTGYADGRRWLIVPGHNTESYQWIEQTQQMLSTGEWRIRRVDYENAPVGRNVDAASPYRWWLGLLAWSDHVLSGRPIGQSVERAALFADPLIQALVLVGVAAFVTWQFGTMPAILAAFACAGLFPFSASYAAGIPTYHGTAFAAGLWSLLLLAAGMTAVRPVGEGGLTERNPRKRMRRFFLLSGIFGGFGLWVSVGILVPIVVGTVLGAIVMAVFTPRNESDALIANGLMPPWRTWACGGAFASLAGYLVEFFPGSLKLQLESNNPVYALAWLAVGELLARTSDWIARAHAPRRSRWVAFTVLAVVTGAALPLVPALQQSAIFAQERHIVTRLTSTQDITADSVLEWISRDGLDAAGVAVAMPLAIAAVACILVLRSRDIPSHRALALVLGPAAVELVFAYREIWWWNGVDAVLVVLLVLTTNWVCQKNEPSPLKWVWSGFAALVLAASATQVLPQTAPGKQNALTYSEGESYIERDLGHWLAVHRGLERPLVLAPPNLTTTLCFHGGLRGLGTLNWENQGGIMGAVRIVSALSAEEAQALIRKRGVTHIVIPSWEPLLDQYARLGARGAKGSGANENSFLAALHRWDLPEWLRPIAYKLPGAAGTTEPSVVILEVVDEQNPAVATSRLAEYFVEMERVDLATAVIPNLERLPGDIGVLTALASIHIARGDRASAATTIAKLLQLLPMEERRPLPFDRRVSLAILLAQYKQADLSLQQFERCLEEMDELKLRSLSTVSLYRLELLSKLFRRPIPDTKLRDLARALLPADLRSRL